MLFAPVFISGHTTNYMNMWGLSHDFVGKWALQGG